MTYRALPVIAGVYRCAIRWRYGAGGPTAINVLHVLHLAGSAAAAFAALDANVVSALWAGMSSTSVADQVAVTPLDGTSATVNFTPSGAKWTGNVVASEYTPSLALVVSLRTAKRGAQYRGRIYLPFQTELGWVDGVANGSLATNQSAWNTFQTAMGVSNYPLHVASYGFSQHKVPGTGGAYSVVPVTWTPHAEPVTSINVESVGGTQRRRQSRLR